MKMVMLRLCGAMAALALLVTNLNVNSTCAQILYQPTIPEEAKKLRRF